MVCVLSRGFAEHFGKARFQAHNLKVVGSNPTPATKLSRVIKRLNAALRGGVCVSSHRGSTVEARGNEVPRVTAKIAFAPLQPCVARTGTSGAGRSRPLAAGRDQRFLRWGICRPVLRVSFWGRWSLGVSRVLQAFDDQVEVDRALARTRCRDVSRPEDSSWLAWTLMSDRTQGSLTTGRAHFRCSPRGALRAPRHRPRSG